MVSLKKSFSALTGFVDYNPTTDANHIWQESFCSHFVSCPRIPWDSYAQQHYAPLLWCMFLLQATAARIDWKRGGKHRPLLNPAVLWSLSGAPFISSTAKTPHMSEGHCCPFSSRKPTDRVWQETCVVHMLRRWWLFFRTSALPCVVHQVPNHSHWLDPYWWSNLLAGDGNSETGNWVCSSWLVSCRVVAWFEQSSFCARDCLKCI